MVKLALILFLIGSPALAINEYSVHIDQPPQIVWEGIERERRDGKDVTESIELDRIGNDRVFKEKMLFQSPIGEATLLFLIKETKFSRVEFILLESDKFKDMSGFWFLDPDETGTNLTLRCTSKLKGFPFIPQFLVDSITKQRVRNRLERVKGYFEKCE